MSRPITPIAEAVAESMETEADTQEVTEETESAPKAKKAKAPDSLTREPGKSVLPYSRVQKILKADKDLVMVQREATFLISRATEEFIGRLAEAAQRLAERERRTTVQAKDIVTTVRRAEEFAFLEELFPWSELEQPARRKPKAAREKEEGGERDDAPTMLDQFVSKTTRGDTQDDEEDEGGPVDANYVMNEDGTMSAVPSGLSEPS
ncbi:histone-fold-containing protein [Trametes elegans]|nr:histone-fold-containing protein [Trametes elegans]